MDEEEQVGFDHLLNALVRFTRIMTDLSVETTQGRVSELIPDPTSDKTVLIILAEGPSFVWRTDSKTQQLEVL